MKNKKKIFTIIFALALLSLMLTSCYVIDGSNGNNDNGSDDTVVTSDVSKDVVLADDTVTYDESKKNVLSANVQSSVPTVYEDNEIINYETPASDFEYTTRSNGTIQITGYKGNDCTIVIPEYIGDTKSDLKNLKISVMKKKSEYSNVLDTKSYLN